jgi:pyruvate ferredoxin oxidoreductase gamma subunit
LKEIRIHGRGGQGSLVLAQFIAIAALEDGKFSQAFPFLGAGGERRGKPIQAFARIDDRFIRLRSRVHQPDYVMVQDPTIINEIDVLEGLKTGGTVLINTEKSLSPSDREGLIRWVEVPASKIALEVLGRPLMNAALLGAFCVVTEEISFRSVEKAIRKRFPGEVGRQNVEIARKARDYSLKEKL